MSSCGILYWDRSLINILAAYWMVASPGHQQPLNILYKVKQSFSLMGNYLTLVPLDKMATSLAAGIFRYIFWNENDRILIQISLKFVPVTPIDNKPAFVQVMVWHLTGKKPLPEPMMTQFIWRIYVSLEGKELNLYYFSVDNCKPFFMFSQ